MAASVNCLHTGVGIEFNLNICKKSEMLEINPRTEISMKNWARVCLEKSTSRSSAKFLYLSTFLAWADSKFVSWHTVSSRQVILCPGLKMIISGRRE